MKNSPRELSKSSDEVVLPGRPINKKTAFKKKFLLLKSNYKAKQDIGKLMHCRSVLFFLLLNNQVILIQLGRELKTQPHST